jgi:hypothetical protein
MLPSYFIQSNFIQNFIESFHPKTSKELKIEIIDANFFGQKTGQKGLGLGLGIGLGIGLGVGLGLRI